MSDLCMTLPLLSHSEVSHSLGNTSFIFFFKGAEICLNFLSSGQGEADLPLWSILMSKTPSSHALGQDIVFCTYSCCQQI